MGLRRQQQPKVEDSRKHYFYEEEQSQLDAIVSYYRFLKDSARQNKVQRWPYESCITRELWQYESSAVSEMSVFTRCN